MVVPYCLTVLTALASTILLSCDGKTVSIELTDGKTGSLKFLVPFDAVSKLKSFNDMYEDLGTEDITFTMGAQFASSARIVQKILCFTALKNDKNDVLQKAYLKQESSENITEMLRVGLMYGLINNEQKKLVEAIPSDMVKMVNAYFINKKPLPEWFEFRAAQQCLLWALPLLNEKERDELKKVWYPKQYESKEFSTFRNAVKNVKFSWFLSDNQEKSVFDTAFAIYAQSFEYQVCDKLGCSVLRCCEFYEFYNNDEIVKHGTELCKDGLISSLLCHFRGLHLRWREYTHLPFLLAVTGLCYNDPLITKPSEKNGKIRLYDIDVTCGAERFLSAYGESGHGIQPIHLADDMPVPFKTLRKIHVNGKIIIEHATAKPYCGLLHREYFAWHACKSIFRSYVLPIGIWFGVLCGLDKLASFLNNKYYTMVAELLLQAPFVSQCAARYHDPNLFSGLSHMLPLGHQASIENTLSTYRFLFNELDAGKSLISQIGNMRYIFLYSSHVIAVINILGFLIFSVPMILYHINTYKGSKYPNVRFFEKFLSYDCFSCHLTVKRPEKKSTTA